MPVPAPFPLSAPGPPRRALCCLRGAGRDAERTQSSDHGASTPTPCSADPLSAPAGVWCPEPRPCLPPGGLLASRTFCLLLADATAFPADLRRVQMHLINKECAAPAEWLQRGRAGVGRWVDGAEGGREDCTGCWSQTSVGVSLRAREGVTGPDLDADCWG